MTKLISSESTVINKVGEVTQGLGFQQLPVDGNAAQVSFSEYLSDENQIPAIDFTTTVVTFNIPGLPIDELTFANNSEFTLTTNRTALMNTGLTLGRTGGGGQPEKIWFWLQIRVSTGPDVWENLGLASVVAITNVTTVTTSISFSLLEAEGVTFRFVMESEDASENIGLFAEVAANNHPNVASARVEFNFFGV